MRKLLLYYRKQIGIKIAGGVVGYRQAQYQESRTYRAIVSGNEELFNARFMDISSERDIRVIAGERR